MTMTESPRNEWRQETPGTEGWAKSAHPGEPDKYLMISADCHAQEPSPYLAEYIEPEFRDRIPHLERRDDGSEWMITEGNRPMHRQARPARRRRCRTGSRSSGPRTTATRTLRMEPEDVLRNKSGPTIEERLADQRADGIDIELIFPNKGLLCWATPDPVFADAMCRAWNRWAYDWFGGADGWNDGRTRPLASIATGDVELATAVGDVGGRARLRRPVPRQQPGLRAQAVGPPRVQRPGVRAVLGVDGRGTAAASRSTCRPAATRGPSAATAGRSSTTSATRWRRRSSRSCSSSRRACSSATRRCRPGWSSPGIGFVPWLLETMDYAYRAHHFWVRPVIPELPSSYFRRNCFATFQEDHVGLADGRAVTTSSTT